MTTSWTTVGGLERLVGAVAESTSLSNAVDAPTDGDRTLVATRFGPL
jgi:hypothetical protein